MRVLLITNDLFGNGGYSRYGLDLVYALRNIGCDVVCVTNKKSSTALEEYPILKADYKYLANPFRSFIDTLKLNHTIKKTNPDIIHFIVEPYCTMIPFLNVKDKKVFLTMHGTYSFLPNVLECKIKKTISKLLTYSFLKKVDGIIIVSNFTKNYFLQSIKNYRGKSDIEKKTTVITNGVNLKNITPVLEKQNNKTKQVLFVGAVKPRKGILEAIEVLKYYYDNFSKDFIYNIVGSYDTEDPYFKEISEKINSYKLGGNILFIGRIGDDELKKYYENADLFLMLPINNGISFEGFGLVYLEANARGIPTVGSKNCGVEDAISDNLSGYLVDPYNKKEVAERINAILNTNVIDRTKCVEWAEDYDITKTANKIFDLYVGK